MKAARSRSLQSRESSRGRTRNTDRRGRRSAYVVSCCSEHGWKICRYLGLRNACHRALANEAPAPAPPAAPAEPPLTMFDICPPLPADPPLPISSRCCPCWSTSTLRRPRALQASSQTRAASSFHLSACDATRQAAYRSRTAFSGQISSRSMPRARRAATFAPGVRLARA